MVHTKGKNLIILYNFKLIHSEKAFRNDNANISNLIPYNAPIQRRNGIENGMT
jgi:hypothetical protein